MDNENQELFIDLKDLMFSVLYSWKKIILVVIVFALLAVGVAFAKDHISLGNTDTVSSATIYLNVATTLKAFKQPKKAIPLFEKAFSIYSKDLEKNRSLLSGFYNNKALTLVDLKDFKGAIKCYNLALENLKFTDRELTDGAITFVNMAHLYDTLSNRQKTVDCLFSAFDLLNNEQNEHNGYYAYVLEKCAPSFRQFGYEKIADDFEKLSREIYERT